MARTDILLDSDGIDAIAADGSFNLATAAGNTPDIRLTPDRASLQLGGGQGNFSHGRLELVTGEGASRISLSSTTSPDSEEHVVSLGVEQDAGKVLIGRAGESDATLELNAETVQLKMAPGGGAESTVDLDGEGGILNLGNGDTSGHIFLGGGRRGPQSAIALSGSEATITVGGSPGMEPGHTIREKAGRIVLVDTANTETVTIEGETEGETQGGSMSLRSFSGAVSIQAAGGSQGGKIRLETGDKATAATIDGGTGTLLLGWSPPITMDTKLPENILPERVTGPTPQPVNGELWLDDGAGSQFGLKADDGAVGLGPASDAPGGVGLVLKPEEGGFSIVDGNGDPVFRIDTQNKKIQMAEDYTQETI